VSVHSGEIRVSTRGDGDVVDLTEGVARIVATGAIDSGVVNVFVRGSTASVTTMEFEPGGVQDLGEMLERLIPRQGDYEHNRLNHDSNSHAHQRASVIGASTSVPFHEGTLALGTWQQIVLVDFDDRHRERTVVVSVLG